MARLSHARLLCAHALKAVWAVGQARLDALPVAEDGLQLGQRLQPLGLRALDQQVQVPLVARVPLPSVHALGVCFEHWNVLVLWMSQRLKFLSKASDTLPWTLLPDADAGGHATLMKPMHGHKEYYLLF